jgi:NADH:ubiquinone oxidoreductase subunit K
MTITLTILLFLCGLAGFILNRNNVILLIVAIELLLLAVIKKTLDFLFHSLLSLIACLAFFVS